MGPSTPPEHEFLATPSTPQRDHQDAFDVDQLRGKAPVQSSVQSPARTPRARHVLMTPGTTPRRRVLFPPTTPVRGSGRQGRKTQLMSSRASAETIPIPRGLQTPARTPRRRDQAPQTPHAPTTPQTPRAPRTPANLEFALRAAAGASPRADAAANASAHAARNDSEPAVYTSHRSAPDDKPGKTGMWYVFRGKKIFRPFERDEEPLRPVRLFAAELGAPTTDSEDETDHDSS